MEQYLTQKEAQYKLGVSRTTLFNWRRSKKINAYKVKGSIQYKESELDKLMKPILLKPKTK